MIEYTIGALLGNPIGTRVTATSVSDFAEQLRSRPADLETWFSPHLWSQNKRSSENWESSCGVFLDVDYCVKRERPPTSLTNSVVDFVRTGQIPGNLFYLTPNGFRVLFIYEQPCRDRDSQREAARAAEFVVAKALTDTGLTQYEVDSACTKDLGRLLFAPNSIAKNIRRVAETIVIRNDPYPQPVLADLAPSQKPVKSIRLVSNNTRDGAIDAWNAAHPQDWGKAASCPICGHNGCFGNAPGDNGKWFCFSSNHKSGGLQTEGGFIGDALDIHCHTNSVKRSDVLREFKKSTVYTGEIVDNLARDQKVNRPWCSRSLLTTMELIGKDVCNILEGKRLRLNLMTDMIMFGKSELRDSDLTQIRVNIEREFNGNDKGGGLKQTKSDIGDAVKQIAEENAYHPVQEYLESIRWDGVERLNLLPSVLGAEQSELNSAMLRKWAISAVARAMDPGCRVDTVLILVGGQGEFKSSFFQTMASDDWFSDSECNVHNKDSYQVLQRTWIYEWAELSVMNKSTTESLKSFITGRQDTYRKPYASLAGTYKRGCVIVGTTNNEEIFSDNTGNRRFWPVKIKYIDIKKIARERDQLWAEAKYRYESGEQWYLEPHHEINLTGKHKEHEVTDAWDDAIWKYANESNEPFTVAMVFENISKGIGLERLNKVSSNRITSSLRRAGFHDWRPTNSSCKAWSR